MSPLRCWFRHAWETQQFSVEGGGCGTNRGSTFVIAWKQCPRCGGSKLIHILV